MFPDLDTTRLNTDWDDLFAIFADMKKFAAANPGWSWLCADDPGVNYTPPRIARMGWCAFKGPAASPSGYRDNDEQMKSWTITLANVKKSMEAHEDAPVSETIRRAIQTAAGRQGMLQALVGQQGWVASGGVEPL